LIFQSWQKGNKYWLYISPYIFYVVLILNYLVIPIGNIILAAFTWSDPYFDVRNEIAEIYVVFFVGNCASRIVEYFTVIQRTVVLNAMIFLRVRKDIEESGYSAEELAR